MTGVQRERNKRIMQFRDLKKQYKELKQEIDGAVNEVLQSAAFVSGAPVHELEEKLADYVGVKHCISCANGTDALTLALMAWGIGEGDAVFVPDFTFFSTAECPAAVGARPVFVDVKKETYNMDPVKLEGAILHVKKEGKVIPRAVIAVDLFGQPAEYGTIRKICDKYSLFLLEDGAQGFGGSIGARRACSFGDISTTSFFPAKPLGCYGDGGAVFTDRDDWAELIRSYAVHGKNKDDRYDNVRIGMNSRLDTIQAAILLVKLKHFQERELDDVNQAAEEYEMSLSDTGLILPHVKEGMKSSWAQYTVKFPTPGKRAEFMKYLKQFDIPTMIYYKKPLHKQGAFQSISGTVHDCEITKELCERVVSLPIHPYLKHKDILWIAEKIKSFRE